MDKVVKHLLDNINNTQNQQEIEDIIEDFDIKSYTREEMKKITVSMLSCIEVLEGRRVFDFMEALYKSNNKRKFDLFCYLLYELSEELTIIPRIDRDNISTAKLKVFMPTLISVLIKANNSIANILMVVLIDNYESYKFNNEEELAIINNIEKRMEIILKRLKNNKNELSKKDLKTLEILIDLSKYFSNDYILEMILDCLKINNEEILLYSLITLLKNDIDFDDKYIEEGIENLRICTRLFDGLRENNILEYIPKKRLTQEYLAQIEFIKWLEEKSIIKSSPDELEYEGTFKDDDLIYFAFKFKHEDLGKDWKIGIAGGYLEQQFPTVKNTKETFSCYDKYKEKNYQKQIEKIIDKSREKIIEEKKKQKEEKIKQEKITEEKQKAKVRKKQVQKENVEKEEIKKIKKRSKSDVAYNIF